MLQDEKILITGPAGRIAYGLARSLVAENEVWGIARFSDPATRDKVEALGVTTRTLDLADGDFGDLPADFTYLLHLVADFSPDDYDRALRVNAEGTGFVLEHCRNAKAALVMSTVTVYKPHPDPWHAFREDDALGDAMAPPSAPYSVTKIAEEGVARYCARSFGLPTTIARMGAAYSDQSGLPVWHLDAIAAGEPVHTRWDPMTYSPIHDDDICAHLEPLLDAATRSRDHRQLGRRRTGQRAGVLGVLRRSPGRRRRGGGRPRSRARRTVPSPTTPSAPRSPARARWGGAKVSDGWPSTSIPTASGAPVRWR